MATKPPTSWVASFWVLDSNSGIRLSHSRFMGSASGRCFSCYRPSKSLHFTSAEIRHIVAPVAAKLVRLGFHFKDNICRFPKGWMMILPTWTPLWHTRWCHVEMMILTKFQWCHSQFPCSKISTKKPSKSSQVQVQNFQGGIWRTHSWDQSKVSTYYMYLHV